MKIGEEDARVKKTLRDFFGMITRHKRLKNQEI
jgi:hypothetical protein